MSIDIEQAFFSGPMDLLLQLIEKEEVDIWDVEISKITDEYLKQLEVMKEEKDDLTDFIDMASTLVYIKSRELLPKKEEEDEEEISEEILKQRIIEYKKMKELSKSLLDLSIEQDLYYERVKSDLSVFETDPKEEVIEYDLDLLLKSMREILERTEETEEDRFEMIRAEEYSVEDYVGEIEWMMRPEKNYELEDFILRDGSRFEIITIFLSVLELMKNRKVRVKQNEEKIYIRWRESDDGEISETGD